MGRRLLVVFSLVLLACATGGLWMAHHRLNNPESPGGHAPFRMSDRLSTLRVVETGGRRELAFGEGAGEVRMAPDAFARQLHALQAEKERGGWWFKVLDITSLGGLFWVALGFLGQFMFTGRMLVQWIASERAKRSVVPTAFWWMSLFGSSLLILYFSWRIDVVGVLGQATGWIIYIRNLWLLQGAANAKS